MNFSKNILTKKKVDRIERYVQNIVIVVNKLNFIIRNLDMIQQTLMKQKICAELIDTVAAKNNNKSQSI